MSERTIRMMCPNLTCRKVLSVPEAARGKTVRCKQCGTNIRVPQSKTNTPSDKQDLPQS
jgi:RNase P subunit RPR2